MLLFKYHIFLVVAAADWCVWWVEVLKNSWEKCYTSIGLIVFQRTAVMKLHSYEFFKHQPQHPPPLFWKSNQISCNMYIVHVQCTRAAQGVCVNPWSMCVYSARILCTFESSFSYSIILPFPFKCNAMLNHNHPNDSRSRPHSHSFCFSARLCRLSSSMQCSIATENYVITSQVKIEMSSDVYRTHISV